jgi:hydrogenase expression/formation protein HypE
LQDVIWPRLDSRQAPSLEDSALLPPFTGRPLFTTDSFVVSPLFFPGGDIGTLAVYGTVNDLVVAGAQPKWLSLALIVEEGLPLATLERVLSSVARAAQTCGVAVVTGDTKVVPRGTADQIFINTAGLGELLEPAPDGPAAIRPGDELLVSGPIGRHGIAVLAAREQLGFDPPPLSDCGSLLASAAALRSAGIPLRAMRDATRGGLAAVLHEWAAACGCTLAVEESQIPVTDDVRGACELLGLDPLHIACEGTMAIAVPPGWGHAAARALRECPDSDAAAPIGQAVARAIAPVTVRRILGRFQPLDDPGGSLLPRIC